MTPPTVPPSRPAETPSGRTPQDYETLLRQIAERVWKLWQEDLRRARERQPRRER